MTVRVGLVGTGYWGKNLLRVLNSLGALAAFCENDEAAAQPFITQYPNARHYAEFDEMLRDDTIESVVISTPAATHGVLTRQALETGRHVFVEKPLCLDVSEARSLAELAEAQGVVLMVGHLLLYHPAFVATAFAVQEGQIGTLQYIYSNRASLGKIRREENALWSFAPHDISMILALTKRMPNRVTCTGEAWLSPQIADLTLSQFEFGDKLHAHIFVSWLHPFKDHRLVVIGDKGMLVFNDSSIGPEKLTFYSHKVGWEGDLPVVDKADAVPVPYGSEEPLQQEIAHFIDCCVNGKQPTSDSWEGLRVLSVLDMCQRALLEKMPITFEEESNAR